MHYVLILISLY